MLAASNAASTSEEPVSVIRTGLPHDALYDVVFAGDQGYAVGAHGHLLVSEDGGTLWSDADTAVDVAMLGAAAAAERLILAGQQGKILAGTSAQTLALVESPTSERLLSVALHESGLAVAVGGFGTVLISEDAGATWRQEFLDWMEFHPEGLEAHLYDISISESGDILICGEFAMILASTDRGKTWDVRHSGDASLMGIHIDKSGVGLAVGQDGTILRTTDNGATWQAVETESTANLLDVWLSPEGEAVAIGIRSLMRSSDMGQSWTIAKDRSIDRTWYSALASGVVKEDNENGSLSMQTVYAVGQFGNIVTINE